MVSVLRVVVVVMDIRKRFLKVASKGSVDGSASYYFSFPAGKGANGGNGPLNKVERVLVRVERIPLGGTGIEVWNSDVL